MAVPTVPSSLLEPVWAEFTALLPERGEFHPDHPLGCHRRRIPDRAVFEHIVEALVHGSGYERIASSACSDATIRRRLKQWAAAGIAEQVHATKAPCGGDKPGPSPVDRRKGGLKRSVATDGGGVPLGIVSAGADRHDSPLLGSHPARRRHPGGRGLARAGHRPPRRRLRLHHHLHPARRVGPARRDRPQGHPRPGPGRQTMGRRAHSLLDEWLRQAASLHRPRRQGRRLLPLPCRRVRTVRALIREARTRYRWDTRPTTRRLK
jgi:Putative transposase of IS4/5 family (DUF4096)